MQTQYFSEAEKGIKDIGWLKSNFYFSFSDFCDPSKSAFGTLVTFNDDYVQAGKGFGIHPHINMEIISVLLKGRMNHIDSLGYSTMIEGGGVQIMSAGSGLRHEEYNVGEKEDVNFLQIWIQPKIQNIHPRYQLRSFPKEKRTDSLKVIVSHEEGQEHCWINQNAKLSLGNFSKGSEISYRFNPTNMCLFIFVIEGHIQIERQDVIKRNAIGIWDTPEINIHCSETSDFLVIECPVNQK